jgi:hypothetical protein
MTLNAVLILGLILLTAVCGWYVRSGRRRQSAARDHTLSEFVTRGEQWPYDLPDLQRAKESWRKNWKNHPPDSKDPIDSRD